jgi:ketosteroid isomerase-like protein
VIKEQQHMKRGFILLSIAATASLALAQDSFAQPRQTSKAEEEVRQAENARREAILQNDTAALDRLMANSYMATLDAGDVKTKADEIALDREGSRKIESWEASDVVIRLYGNTAVVTGRAAVKDSLRDEGMRDFTFRFTHVWIKLDGRWQLVARHISGRSVPRSRRQ